MTKPRLRYCWEFSVWVWRSAADVDLMRGTAR